MERQAAAEKEASEVEQNVDWLGVVLVHVFLRFEEAVGLRGVGVARPRVVRYRYTGEICMGSAWLQSAKGWMRKALEVTTSVSTPGTISSSGLSVPLLLLPRSEPSTKSAFFPKNGAWIGEAVPETTLVQGTAEQRG